MAVMIGQTTLDPGSTTPTDAGAATTTGRSGESAETATADTPVAEEFGGRDGPDPTRFGDWEKNGRCIDF
ncbi:DUF1674 domain-containing protein [Lysobacter sp. F6437]|uniref:DUF1674 domain-containing protein n=1 Tax=Lysobacter sp. F6437 TaxID=3459296 RepID=UPI00403DBF04